MTSSQCTHAGVLVKIPEAVRARYASKKFRYDLEPVGRYLPSQEAMELFETLLNIDLGKKVYLDDILNAYENANDAIWHLTELGARELVFFWDEWTDYFWEDEGWKEAIFDLMGDKGGDPDIWD